MYNKKEAFDILAKTIIQEIRHQDYTRVVELAKKYKAMISGENMEEFIKRFNMREDDELFKQRLRLTNVIVSSITGSLITPEKKIPGIKPIIKEFSYAKEEEKKKKDLDELVNDFYGLHGVDEFLRDHFMNLSDSDPNAFLLYLFKPFDSTKEKPSTYAISISSEEAIDFEYENNILQYLTVMKPIKYVQGKSDQQTIKDGYRYSIFTDNPQVEFTQVDVDTFSSKVTERVLVDSNGAAVDVETAAFLTKYYYATNANTLFEVIFYETKAKQVPAFRIGNIPDIATDRRTRVNVWHRAMPYLMKSIKTVSELDLTATLHAFPKEFTYEPRCKGSMKDGNHVACSKGYDPSGNVCKTCNGTGTMRQDSAQSTIRLAMPADPSDVFDLTKLSHYAALPIEFLEWADKYVDKLEAKAKKAVYDNDVVSQEQLQPTTATKVLTERQSQYDALSPLAYRYSYAWKFTITQIANYSDLEKDLLVQHLFPSDFHFETITEMIDKIKAAKDANVDDYILQQMNNDLTGLVYVDQPEVLKQIKVKSLFNPFEGKSESTTLSIISNKNCTKYDIVLWSNFKSIFTEVEHEANKEKTSFYDLTYAEQKKRIDTKVKTKIIEIDSEQQLTIDNTSAIFNDNTNGNDGDLNNASNGDSPTDGSGDRLGKLPLAVQQMSLAITRLKEAGLTDSANKVKQKLDEIVREIDLIPLDN